MKRSNMVYIASLLVQPCCYELEIGACEGKVTFSDLQVLTSLPYVSYTNEREKIYIYLCSPKYRGWRIVEDIFEAFNGARAQLLGDYCNHSLL